MSLKIISIEYVGTENNYVYDLETEDGTYYAGDDILAKNTDSIMTVFPVDTNRFVDEDTGLFDKNMYIQEHFNKGRECAKAITASNKDPIKIELEKAMSPFNLMAKKKYIYVEWSICSIYGSVISASEPENRPGFKICPSCKIYHTIPDPDDPEKQDIKDLDLVKSKGVVLARRDTCKYVKDILQKILEIAMLNIKINNKEKCIEEAKKYSIKAVSDLLNGKVAISDLVLSKSLNGNYKVPIKYTGPNISNNQQSFLSNSGTIIRPEPEPDSDQEQDEISMSKNISIKWDNVFCTKCQLEIPDPNFNEIKGCPGCKMCKEHTRCTICTTSISFVKFPHVYVAKKLKMLNPMDHLTPPNRIPYVFIKVPGISRDAKQCDIVEHPEHLGTKKIDYNYYFDRQLKEPLCEIINVISGSLDSFNELYNNIIIDSNNKSRGIKSLNSIFTKIN